MVTTAEVRATKVERQRHALRLFTPDRLGKPCVECRNRVVAAVGEDSHPTCCPEFRYLQALARAVTCKECGMPGDECRSRSKTNGHTFAPRSIGGDAS